VLLLFIFLFSINSNYNTLGKLVFFNSIDIDSISMVRAAALRAHPVRLNIIFLMIF